MIHFTSVTKLGRYLALSLFWFLMLLVLNPLSAHALKFEKGFGYTNRQGQIVIEAYQGIGGNLVIPPTFEGLPVVSIGSRAFSTRGIYSVVIPEGVTLINPEAFLNCYNLTNVVIPDSVTRIGSFAFLNCSVLENVNLPERLTEIIGGTFRNCYLQTLIIPKSVTRIEAGAFRDCGALTNMFFEGAAPILAGDAFAGAPKLTLYYLWGAAGWQSKIGGRPTALWKPRLQAVSQAGQTIAKAPEFLISYGSDRTVLVESATDPKNPKWNPVIELTTRKRTASFVDQAWQDSPKRFYRVTGF